MKARFATPVWLAFALVMATVMTAGAATSVDHDALNLPVADVLQQFLEARPIERLRGFGYVIIPAAVEHPAVVESRGHIR